MKWLFFKPKPSPTPHKVAVLEPYNIKIGKFVPTEEMIENYDRHIIVKSGKKLEVEKSDKFLNRMGKSNMKHLYWVPALKADFTHMWANFDPDDYDGFMAWLMNIDIGRTTHLRRIAGDRPVVGLWEAWHSENRNFNDPRIPEYKKDIKACDVVIQDRRFISGPHIQNWFFSTNKFEYCQHPIHTEWMKTFTVGSGERLERKQVISSWYKGYKGGKYNVEIFKRFLKKHNGWNGIMSWGEHMGRETAPFKPLPELRWRNFLKTIGESYIGIGSSNGGPANIHAYAATMGIPSVGSTVTGTVMNCFPELGREYNDFKGQAELLCQLVEDESFYNEMSEKGIENIEEIYSFKGARNKLIEILKRREII